MIVIDTTEKCCTCGKEKSIGDMLLDMELRYNCRKCVLSNMASNIGNNEIPWLNVQKKIRTMNRHLNRNEKQDFPPFTLQYGTKHSTFGYVSANNSTNREAIF